MKSEKEISERAVLLGYRMKLAAEQAGLGKVDLCREAVGKGQGTISRWWRGLQTPSLDDLTVYAQVMGKSIAWFYETGPSDKLDAVAEALAQIVDLSIMGKSLAESHKHVTGEADRYGRRERERLAAGTSPLLDRINQETGGRWNDLDSRQKREVMNRLRSEAERLRQG